MFRKKKKEKAATEKAATHARKKRKKKKEKRLTNFFAVLKCRIRNSGNQPKPNSGNTCLHTNPNAPAAQPPAQPNQNKPMKTYIITDCGSGNYCSSFWTPEERLCTPWPWEAAEIKAHSQPDACNKWGEQWGVDPDQFEATILFTPAEFCAEMTSVGPDAR